ncbi:hypothetical protein PBT90_11230 [Algoriphagus halophytocola]|uniref:Glycosyltransferase RgtA/B/C/D-like domain-containing protein n=1 Tax=Algoriphagus halophytocola TaxID=2991499 RepID=A0ABY6MJJ6_9BACT|nr:MULTISPECIES: hypothetical protein [unclassified Algoriphagus]UZD23957.1 hypothetical protein OM944_05550 [Algoriphagus sp. TR-M5]WBL41328.1 hypothetical protein PBT90_11230 [Algoriphagus sp. TR-M9]
MNLAAKWSRNIGAGLGSFQGAVFIFLILFYTLFPWRFQVNDDVIMMWLVSGAYTGNLENYIVFIHPILSLMLTWFYGFIETVPWYSIGTFSALYYGFFLLEWQLRNQGFGLTRKYLLRTLLLATLIHLAAFPQFTLVSGFLSLASLTFIFNPNWSGEPNSNILGWIGACLAMAIRLEAFTLVLAGFSLFHLSSRRIDRSVFFKMGLVVFILLGFYFSKLIYEKNSDFTDYLTFNKARHEVIDHPVFYELSVEDALIGDDKWYYFSQWFFQESEITIEDLNGKKVQLDQAYWSWDSFRKSILRYFSVQKHELFKGFLSFAYLFLVLKYSGHRRKLFLPLLVWGLFFLFTNHIFHFRGRVVFIFSLILLVPIWNLGLKAIPKKMCYALSTVICLFTLIHVGNVLLEASRRKQILKEFHELEKSVFPNEMFFTEGFPLEYFSKDYDIVQPTPFLINGWVSRSPFQQNAMERLGFSSYRNAENFAILQVKEDRSYSFSAYLEHLGHHLEPTDSISTEHLILIKYQSTSASESLP